MDENGFVHSLMLIALAGNRSIEEEFNEDDEDEANANIDDEEEETPVRQNLSPLN